MSPCHGVRSGFDSRLSPQFMRTQEQVQFDILRLVETLAERRPLDTGMTFGDTINGFPDLKSRWDSLLKEVDELKAKGAWKIPPQSNA